MYFEKEVLDSKEYEIGMVCQKALQILWEEAAQVDQRKAIISDNLLNDDAWRPSQYNCID